jgi:hypothetical protein
MLLLKSQSPRFRFHVRVLVTNYAVISRHKEPHRVTFMKSSTEIHSARDKEKLITLEALSLSSPIMTTVVKSVKSLSLTQRQCYSRKERRVNSLIRRYLRKLRQFLRFEKFEWPSEDSMFDKNTHQFMQQQLRLMQRLVKETIEKLVERKFPLACSIYRLVRFAICFNSQDLA